MWFERLVGFPEGTGDDVRSRLAVDGEWVTSSGNGRRMRSGTLTMPSLAQLRADQARGDVVAAGVARSGRNTLREIVADVRDLHRDPGVAGATFQVASQFSLLEMIGSSVTPDDGIERYENDGTQGPACAMSCGAGTILRNYLVPVDGVAGQSADRQLDGLADLRRRLAGDAPGWRMVNGYALFEVAALDAVNARLTAMTADQVDEARGLLRVGVHRNVEVTTAPSGHAVNQVFCSALPVTYNDGVPRALFEPLGRLVLEAAYEATLLAAAEADAGAAAPGAGTLYLTLLGGGAFGNERQWIFDAIERALDVVGDRGLDVAVVSHGSSNGHLADLIGDNLRGVG